MDFGKGFLSLNELCATGDGRCMNLAINNSTNKRDNDRTLAEGVSAGERMCLSL